MTPPASLLVLTLPRFSLRFLHTHVRRFPSLRRLAEESNLAVIAPLQDEPDFPFWPVFETGLLPADHAAGRARRFWERASERLEEAIRPIEIASPWSVDAACASVPLLLLRAGKEELPPSAAATLLEKATVFCSGHGRALAVLGESGDAGDPQDWSLLAALGFAQPKHSVGACEVAGILERVLTGEELTDRRGAEEPV